MGNPLMLLPKTLSPAMLSTATPMASHRWEPLDATTDQVTLSLEARSLWCVCRLAHPPHLLLLVEARASGSCLFTSIHRLEYL